MTEFFPLVFIGGGFRTVSFLSQHPRLLDYGVSVFERSEYFGAGAFKDYDCMSTSIASRFFHGVAPEIMDRCELADWISELSNEDSQPIPLQDVSRALQSLGEAVATHPRARVNPGEYVTGLSVGEKAITIKTAAGVVAQAAHVVIATGREERPHNALRRWEAKTLLSSELISRKRAKFIRKTVNETKGPILIAGSSHSAASALIHLLKLREECGRLDLEIQVLRRSGIRLHYDDLEQALASRDVFHESAIDPIMDVCPGTLQVNRDSGLRGAGRVLFRELIAGNLPKTRLIVSESLSRATESLDRASIIIQALGYWGRAPVIHLPNNMYRDSSSETRLLNLPDGTAIIGGQPQPMISVLRVEPTPLLLRDHALYGQGLYERLATRLETKLGVFP